MGITFSKQRPHGGAEGKGSTPSPHRQPPTGMRLPARHLRPEAKEGKSRDARTVAVGSPGGLVGRPQRLGAAPAGPALKVRRMSESDMSAPALRGLARWQVASLPGEDDTKATPQQAVHDSGSSLAWLKDDHDPSPMNAMNFRHDARLASLPVAGPAVQDKSASTSSLMDRDERVMERNLERLSRLQQIAVRVDRKSEEKAVASKSSWQPQPLWPPSVNFTRLTAVEAAQWATNRLREAHAADLDPVALRNLAQELISHHKVLTQAQLHAMGHALGSVVRIDDPMLAADQRHAHLGRLLAPLCALTCRSWSTEQLATLLAGVRSAFPATDRSADLPFQRAVNTALEEGVPLGHCVAMACGLYHGSNDRPGRAFSAVRLDRQAWSSPHERLAAVLNWGRRLVLDAPSVYASDSGVPEDRRFEWMMAALAIPGVAQQQQAVLTQGRSTAQAMENMTPAQRAALAEVIQSVQHVGASPRGEAKSRIIAAEVTKQVQ